MGSKWSWKVAACIAAVLLASAGNAWGGYRAGGSVGISPELAESTATGPVRVIVVLEVPEDGGIKQADNIKRISSAFLSRTAGIAQTLRTYDHLPFVAMEVNGKDGLTALGAMPEVRIVVPDRLRRLPAVHESETAAAAPLVYPENPDRIGAEQAWQEGYTGKGWFVAILDSGILTAHELFAGKQIIEACFSSLEGCPNGQMTMFGAGAAKPFGGRYDGYEHGTHVAGIAVGNSGKLFGVAKDASIIAVQVFSGLTKASDCRPSPAPCLVSFDSDQLAALDYVYSLRNTYQIAAVNMSLGGNVFSSQTPCDTTDDGQLYKPAMDALRSAGIATVIASGNDGSCDGVTTPGCISSAVSVGAVDDTDTETTFNNWHYSMLKLLAPGSDIYSAIPDSPTSYAYLSGTSMATPHVTGAWAILKQHSPQASVSDILSALMDTGLPVETLCRDLDDHKPRIQIDAALSPPPIPVPSSQSTFTYASTASPVLNFSQAMPVGVGPVAGVGDLLNLQVGFAEFAAPVDIYLAFYAKSIDPATIYLFIPGNKLQPLSAGMIPWKSNTAGPVSESLYGELQTSTLSPGDYILYIAAAPAGRLDAYYFWTTEFVIQ
jgi:subtilisin family serine protease